MSSEEFEKTKSIDEPTNPTQQNSCPLQRLPLELREKMYKHIFAKVHAKGWKYGRTHELAILQTCKQFHVEASSTLYNRTPLRFVIGHRQVISSSLPPSIIVDRFKSVSFILKRMSSTHPGYEFIPPFDQLVTPYIQSSVHRNTCDFQCELEEHAGNSCGPALLSKVKLFTGFEILSLTFTGDISKSEFPQEELTDNNPRTSDRKLVQVYRRGMLFREKAALRDLANMFQKLEEHLGPGEMLDVSESSEKLHVTKLVFHPLRHSVKT